MALCDALYLAVNISVRTFQSVNRLHLILMPANNADDNKKKPRTSRASVSSGEEPPNKSKNDFALALKSRKLYISWNVNSLRTSLTLPTGVTVHIAVARGRQRRQKGS